VLFEALDCNALTEITNPAARSFSGEKISLIGADGNSIDLKMLVIVHMIRFPEIQVLRCDLAPIKTFSEE
jgi:hypothetical protein